MNNTYETAIGIDVSDRKSCVCVMTKKNGGTKILRELTIPTTREGLASFLATQDKASTVTFETGTHCRWMHAVCVGAGFKTYVANATRLKLVTQSVTKNDTNDARMLAQMTLADVTLLRPVKLRNDEYQKMLHLHKLRNQLINSRTRWINELRCMAKTMGYRLPECSTCYFHRQETASWPQELLENTWPLLKALEQINITIKTYEKKIRELAETPAFKPHVDRLREINYVGLFVATGFVATIGGDVDKFNKPRDVGPWLGLTPRQHQSGEVDRQCHMTKAGSPFMRRLLVESAQMILRERSVDTDLKLKGIRISLRGGKIAKRKAVTAIARSLATTMVALLKKPDVPYVPLSEYAQKELLTLRTLAQVKGK